jgi:transposase InsO family protein
VIHHSDQGSQYTSIAFGNRCEEAKVRPSMGSVGVPSGEWLEFGGGVISGLFNQPGPALSRRRRSRHDNR